MARNWTNDSGLALSAANLNALEADVTAALGVPDVALEARLKAGTSKTYLDSRYATTTSLNNKQNTLGTGTASQFLRGDLTWAEPPAGGGGGVTTVNTLAELQAAVAIGGVIYVGQESITVTSQVNLTVPVWIIGGRFSLPENAGYPAFNITSSNVSIFLTSFTGATTAAAYSIDSRFITATGTSTTPLGNVNVISATLRGSQTENIRYTWVQNSTISGCRIDDFLYAGVLLLSCVDMTVESCHISNAVMKAPVVNVYGIAATDAVNTVAGRSRNIKIANNTVKNVEWEGIDTHGGDGIVIVGNTVEGCSRGIALVVGNTDRLTVPINCVVSGNLVNKGSFAGTEREAISLFGLTGNLANAVITGNKVVGYTAANAMYIDQYTDPLKTLVGGNSHPHVPWTTVTMDNTAQWTANASYPVQYMVDGTTVFLRGLPTSNSAPTGNTKIATLPPICKPSRLTFAGASHGSNSAAGLGTLGVYDNTGELWMLYKTTADAYSYPVECSYQRNFTG